MTCLAQTAPLAPRGGASLLHALRALWRPRVATTRLQHDLATLDDRALRDLGLTRDVVEQPDRGASADLWLDRVAG